MSPFPLPLVSIITPSYNQSRYIEHLLNSVRQQDYPYIEHIIIDGNSTDGTVDLLKAEGDALTWVSEADSGQAEAINKGFALAKGEILGWINCDDLYTVGAIRAVVDFFLANHEAAIVFGDALAIDAANNSYGLRINVRACDHPMLVQSGDFIVQPATFWRASLWHQIGPLDQSLHYALDYEYWMRVARRHKLYYLPLCLAHERLHQETKTNHGHLKRISEITHVAQQHGGDGIPLRFRGEAAAIHIWQACQELGKGQWRNFVHHLRAGLSLRPQPLKFLIYLCTIFLFGLHSIVRLRLWANRLLSWRKPLYPNDLAQLPSSVVRAIISEQT